jgi:hypothetical protein
MSEDVTGSSSESEFEDDSGTPAGEQGSIEVPERGRSVDNLAAEFNRKQAKLQEQIAGLTESVQKLAQAFVQGQQPQRFEQGNQPPPPPPQRQVPQHAAADLSNYTDEQLQQALASGQLSAYQTKVIEEALQERRLDRRLEAKFAETQKQSQTERLRAESEEAALAAFPALKDKNSEFSRRVEAALSDQRRQLGEFPTDRFDVANRVARIMGVEVSRVITPGFVAKPDSTQADDVEEPSGQTEDEIRAIAANLRYALPLRHDPVTGKMERKKFNLKRIQERSKQYEQNKRAYMPGRRIRGGQ